ncbi:hypothetical protein GCM10008170_06750 [Methylopila capsulata]|uniref:Uncharacterized protein n=1 Tax=Methylopila capsulata TaxID=61654 RepID=A0A9W6MR62_9HYPH|nr:hypothetical protein GCM10008170_06750 [Methylopila capsulata]
MRSYIGGQTERSTLNRPQGAIAVTSIELFAYVALAALSGGFGWAALAASRPQPVPVRVKARRDHRR